MIFLCIMLVRIAWKETHSIPSSNGW